MQKNQIIDKISEFHTITTEQIDNLQSFIDELLIYNQKFNLIGASTIKNIWLRHILDSAQLIEYITDKNSIIADLGSGAGFPGVILSILGVKNIYLIEKSPRKCQFLRKISDISPNKITIIEENIANIKDLKFDIITSRAFAPLDKLLHISQNLLTNKGKYLLLKGKNLKKEVANAQKILKNYRYQILKSKSSDEGNIILIQND